MRLSSSIRLCVAAALGCGAVLAYAGAPLVADGVPAWSDEPPVVARLIEAGYRAERSVPELAAARYCAAARAGSVEGQYRLGRLYLAGRGVARQTAVAATLLGAAARGGHEGAQALLAASPLAPADALPDCLYDTASISTDERDEVVPYEVVDRFVQALPGDKRRHALLVQRLAPRFAVDPRLALAIVRTESNFDAAAVSPKNAQGLMQLIPETAERFGVRNALDPEQNLRGGLAYLRWLLKQFEGDVALAAAAYNAGEGAVARHGGVPPYAETEEYVRRVLAFYRSSRHHAPDGGLAAAPAPARG